MNYTHSTDTSVNTYAQLDKKMMELSVSIDHLTKGLLTDIDKFRSINPDTISQGLSGTVEKLSTILDRIYPQPTTHNQTSQSFEHNHTTLSTSQPTPEQIQTTSQPTPEQIQQQFKDNFSLTDNDMNILNQCSQELQVLQQQIIASLNDVDTKVNQMLGSN